LGTHPHDERAGLLLDDEAGAADGKAHRLLDGKTAPDRWRPLAANVLVREQDLAAALAGERTQRHAQVLRRQLEGDRRFLCACRQDRHAGRDRRRAKQRGAECFSRDSHFHPPKSPSFVRRWGD